MRLAALNLALSLAATKAERRRFYFENWNCGCRLLRVPTFWTAKTAVWLQHVEQEIDLTH
jgi:hypothetical protein